MSMTIWEKIESFDKKIMEKKQNLKMLMKKRNGLYAKLYTEDYIETDKEETSWQLEN